MEQRGGIAEPQLSRPSAVAEVKRLLADPGSANDAVARNYEVGLEHFSFAVVRDVYKNAFEALGL